MMQNDPQTHDQAPEQEAADFVNLLAIYNRQARTYPASHPLVLAAAEKVLKQLSPLTAPGKTFKLGVARHAFMAGNNFLTRHNACLAEYAASLSGLGIITLTFSAELQPAELHRFALVTNRPPNEVWEEGGIKQLFAAAGITFIQVQGLDPSVFTLSEEMPTVTDIGHEGLLERLLRSLLDGTFPASQEKLAQMLAVNPAKLAGMLNSLIAGLSDAMRLATLQKVAAIFTELTDGGGSRQSREEFLRNLVKFVTTLSPELRRDFLSTLLITLRDDSEFADDLFDQLPDEMVIDAVNTVIAHNGEVPHIVLKLMHRLSVTSSESDSTESSPPTDPGKKLQILLRKDEFEKYVPAAYQGVLAAIIHSDRLPESETAELKRLGLTLEHDQLEGAIADVIAEIVKVVPAAEQGEGIQRNLGELAAFFLKRGDFASLARTCRMLKATSGEPYSPVFSPRFVTAVLDAASSCGRKRHAEIRDVIVAVGPPFVAPLLERLAQDENRTLRRFYYDCLHELGDMVRSVALERLQDDRWYFVRNLLVLLRSFPDHEVQCVVRRFLDHPHPKVRNEALKSALYARDPVAERALLQEMKSPDVERQIAAAKLAEMSRSQAVTDRLLGLLDSGTLSDYNLELKQAVVTALAAIGDVRALPRLERLLRSHSLLHPVKHSQLKLAIISSLAGYPAAAANHLIEQFGAGATGKLPGKHAGGASNEP